MPVIVYPQKRHLWYSINHGSRSILAAELGSTFNIPSVHVAYAWAQHALVGTKNAPARVRDNTYLRR
jgi:hypothetical protein